jgi:hypothetical protein
MIDSFLFDHVLLHSNKTLSLLQMAVTIVALRAPTHHYDSSLTLLQPLLLKGQWKKKKRTIKCIVRGGLGTGATIDQFFRRLGLGYRRHGETST